MNISFIVPAFNCEDTIAESVDSIYRGNLQSGDEVIIVNDASTDGTASAIKQLCRKHPDIRVFEHRYNKGSAAASRNTGIEHSTHELIFCWEADNVLAPNSIPRLKECLLESNADAAAMQEFRYFRYHDKPEDTTHKWVFKTGQITLADALAGEYWPGPSGNYLFTKQSWIKAGRHPEDIGGAIDSWAFGIRQLATGTKLMILPDSFYYHRYGYDSTYPKEAAQRNLSLIALQAMIPILHLIEPVDADYIMSRKGRYKWHEQLRERPIRLRGQAPGQTGHVEYLTISPPVKRKVSPMDRVRWKLRQLMGKRK